MAPRLARSRSKTMHRITLAAAAAAAIVLMSYANTAKAADTYPARQRVQMDRLVDSVQPYNWTGFYVGGSIGHNRFNHTESYTSDYYSDSSSMSGKGLSYGGQLGYLHQFRNGIVIGAETDLYLGGGKGSRSVDNCAGCWWGYSSITDHEVKKDFWGSTRAVVGYDWNGIMPYLTGGLAYVRTTESNTTNSSYWGSTYTYGTQRKSAQLGGTIGGGVAAKLNKHWSARVQYLYTSYAMESTTDSYSVAKRGIDKDHAVTFGINYHF